MGHTGVVAAADVDGGAAETDSGGVLTDDQAADAHRWTPGPWRSVLARIGVAAALAAAIELLSPLGWGWPLLLVAGALSVTRLQSWGATVMDRAVPLAWAWVSVLVVLGWVGPFAPWLNRPWFVLLVLAVPFLARGRGLVRGVRFSGGAVREWGAALLPAVVLFLPYLVHRSLGSVVTQLGIGWDTANHLTLLRATLISHGVSLYGPQPDRLLSSDLLDYPSGAHQVWAAWGQTAGLPGNGASDVVQVYPWLALATWMLLGATSVWVYRRLAPWARHRAWRDTAGLAPIVLGIALVPLAGLWYSGFHNYAFAVAGIIAMLGLCVRPPGRPAASVALATALLIAVTTMYTLLLPLAGVAWLVLCWRAVRAGGWHAGRYVVLGCVVAAAGLYPTVLPHLTQHEQLAYAKAMNSGDLLAFTGGLVQIPFGIPLGLVLITLVAVLTWAPFRRRLAGAWLLLGTSVLVWVGVGAYTLDRTGIVGYYAEKVGYAFFALMLPVAAAAVVSCTLAWRVADRPGRAPRWGLAAAGVVTVAASVGLSVVTLDVPRDPAGGIYAAPGYSYLVHSFTERDMTWVTGDRLAALAALSDPDHRTALIPLSSYVGPTQMFGKPRGAESRWLDLLNPIDISATRQLSDLAAEDLSPDGVICAAAVFARNHPGVPVRLVASDEAQAAEARTTLAGCRAAPGKATGGESVDVVVAELPAPSWVLQAGR